MDNDKDKDEISFHFYEDAKYMDVQSSKRDNPNEPTPNTEIELVECKLLIFR